FLQFTTGLLLAIASSVFAGYVRPSYDYGYGDAYGYSLGGTYAAAGSPVVSRAAAYHAAPSHSGYYQPAPVGVAKYATYHGVPPVTAIAAHPAYSTYQSVPAFTRACQAAPVFAPASTVSGLNRYASYSLVLGVSSYHFVPAVSGYAADNPAPFAAYHAAPAVATYHAVPTVAAVQRVSRVSRVDSFHASHQTIVHAAPAVAAVCAPLSTVAHVPAYGAYGYGVGALGYGHGLSTFGYRYGLSAYGHNYAYGLDGLNYRTLIHKKCKQKDPK
ncbi:unnamed protein product, partial [Ixodes hexagonus]